MKRAAHRCATVALIRMNFKWLVIAVILVTLCKIALATLTYGTNDASMWESSASIIESRGGQAIYVNLVDVVDPHGRFVYREIFNHPPFMVYFLAGLNKIQKTTGIPVHVSLRLLDAFCDVGTILLTAGILWHLLGVIPVMRMVLVATAPAWVFISGFHCNSDPLMLFLLILAVYCIDVRGWKLAGICCFALAAGIKMVPIILAPALFLYFRTWRDRLLAVAIPAGFFALTALPWLLTSQWALFHRTLGYGSLTGRWGFGYLLPQIPLAGGLAARAFNSQGRNFLLLVLIGASWLLNRGRRPVPLYYQFGLLFLLFFCLTPGFGIQYLAWLTPWIAIFPAAAIAGFTVAGGLYCAVVYTYWCNGLPWFYANSLAAPHYPLVNALGNALGVIAWLSVLVLLAIWWNDYKRVLEKQPAEVTLSRAAAS